MNEIRANQTASSLDSIEQLIKRMADAPLDVSELKVVLHKASGLSFRVGPMDKKDYETYHKLVSFEDLQYEESGARKANSPKDTNKSDRFLLSHAIWTEEGTSLPENVVEYLINSRGFGPSTIFLVNAASLENPARSDINVQLSAMFASGAANMLVWKVLFDCGLSKALLDKFSSEANPEEKAWAEQQLKKAEEVAFIFEPYFDIAQMASDAGITFKEAAQQNWNKVLQEKAIEEGIISPPEPGE